MHKVFLTHVGWLLTVLTLAACGQPSLMEGQPETLEPLFGTAGYDSASDVAVGPGGVYASGTFGGDAFTQRYDRYGGLLTNLTSAKVGFESTRSVTVGSDGFVYRVTQVEGSGTGTDTEVRKSAKDFHYGVWTRSVASSGGDIAYGVAVDSSGNVYVVGFTTGSLEGSGKGGLDAFVRKYSAGGVLAWTRQFGTAGSDYADAVASPSQYEIYVAGRSSGALAGGSSGGTDAFLRKLSEFGEVWTR